MDWRCGSRVECLLCKCEALSSNPSNTKKKKKKDIGDEEAVEKRKSWHPIGGNINYGKQ
jgi:hypothetical protein